MRMYSRVGDGGGSMEKRGVSEETRCSSGMIRACEADWLK